MLMVFPSCEDAELRRLCSRYGEVQTCINYPNKRHAFVKMTKRAAALAVKESMANKNDPDLASKIRSVSRKTMSHLHVLKFFRSVGVLAMDLVIAAIIKME